jgi:hypothetical protein
MITDEIVRREREVDFSGCNSRTEVGSLGRGSHDYNVSASELSFCNTESHVTVAILART